MAAAFSIFAVAAAGPESQASAATVLQSAPVKIANRLVIDLRGPIAGYSAADRAKGSTERIEKILAAQADRTVSFQEAEDGQALQVLLAGKPAFLIAPIDVNMLAGETPQIVAREAGRRLEIAMGEWGEQRQPRYLAIAAGSAAAATLLFLALAWLTLRAQHWLGGRLSAAAARRSRKLSIGGAQLLDASHVLILVRRGFTLACWLVVLALSVAWLTAVLEVFPYTRPWGEQLNGSLLEAAGRAAVAIAAAVPGLAVVALIFFIARGIARIAQIFFDRAAAGRPSLPWLDAETVRPTRRIFNVIVALFAVAMAYPYLPGANSEAFKGLSVLVGLMVSLGGASLLGQAFSGLILMYAKVFRAGDHVRIGEIEGTVMETRLFATRLRTGMGEEVSMPNAGIMANTIRNYSRVVAGSGYVVDTVVTIGYSTPWRQVHAMLLEAARRTPEIVADPQPIVRQTALSDFYVEYRLAAYATAATAMHRMDVLSQLHANILDVFNEEGVQIMSPHYMVDPARPVLAPREP